MDALADGAGVELLTAVADEPVVVERAAWGQLWPFEGALDAVTRADVTAAARGRNWSALLRAACI